MDCALYTWNCSILRGIGTNFPFNTTNPNLSNIYTLNPNSSANGNTYKSPTAETEALVSSNDFATCVMLAS
jgi:hypothetical protein